MTFFYFGVNHPFFGAGISSLCLKVNGKFNANNQDPRVSTIKVIYLFTKLLTPHRQLGKKKRKRKRGFNRQKLKALKLQKLN